MCLNASLLISAFSFGEPEDRHDDEQAADMNTIIATSLIVVMCIQERAQRVAQLFSAVWFRERV